MRSTNEEMAVPDYNQNRRTIKPCTVMIICLQDWTHEIMQSFHTLNSTKNFPGKAFTQPRKSKHEKAPRLTFGGQTELWCYRTFRA